MKSFFCILLIVFFSSCTIGKKKVEEGEFRGVIVDIYRIFNHNALTFLVRTEYEEFEMLADSWYSVSHYASVGDSIIKLRGELKITIKRESDVPRTFDWRW